MNALPTLFVSHGSPSDLNNPGPAGQQLRELGKSLDGIKAILVVSAHWFSDQLSVSSTATPDTIHDFGPRYSHLYNFQYPVQGHPELAQRCAKVLAEAGWHINIDERRGLDHGAWVPLHHLFPDANIPAFQLSMPYSLNSEKAYKLGKDLHPLISQGVLILASGNLTHNLYDFKLGETQPEEYVEDFVAWVREAIMEADHRSLINTMTQAPYAQKAHPTTDHFLPLLVAAGAAESIKPVTVLEGGIYHASLSMESYLFGR